MGSEPDILDISSDEENRRETGGGCCSTRKPAFASDDDDCVILDGDPDEPVCAESAIGGGDSDDLVVVGSKGQVACRDFPHPRHLCANYDFGTTAHEKHCGQCHCYACDEIAPCDYWGDGTCIIDHCHASDKTEYWKLERQLLKKPDIAPEAPPQALNSVPSRSTSSGINPNPVVGCAPNQTNLPSSQSKNSLRNTSLHHINGTSSTFKRQTHRSPTTLLDSVNADTVNPLPFQPSSIHLPEASQSLDHSHSHLNGFEATNLPQLNSSDVLQNSVPSQPQTSSQHKGDNSVSNSLPNPHPPTSCQSYPYVDSTFHIPNANLQINGSTVPNFNSSWRSSNSNPFLLNSSSSQNERNCLISNSLMYSQPAVACESNSYQDSILRTQYAANLHMNGLKAPNLDSNWRYSNSNSFLQNPLSSQPQTAYSQPATACESNSYVDSTFHNHDANPQINGLNVPHFDSNWRSNSSNQRNQQTRSDLPPPNSSAFLQNPLQAQLQTCSQPKGDNSGSYSQPTAACEPNSGSTFRIPDANLQINWRPNNSNQRNQQSGSDISPQVHDWRRQIYDPCFSSGTNSSLGFVTEPWMIEESLCPMSPELDAYPRPYF